MTWHRLVVMLEIPTSSSMLCWKFPQVLVCSRTKESVIQAPLIVSIGGTPLGGCDA